MTELTAAAAGSLGRRESSGPAEAARAVEVQIRLLFGSSAALASPPGLAAVRAALAELVAALRIPAGAVPGVSLLIDESADTARASAAPKQLLRTERRADGAPRGRKEQSAGAAVTASVGVTLDPAEPGSSVSDASSLGARLSSALLASSDDVGSAVAAALASADPAAAAGGVTVTLDSVFAVVAASDGAVVDASPSVLAATDPGPAATPPLGGGDTAPANRGVGAYAGIGVACAAVVGGLLVDARSRGCGGEASAAERSPVRPVSATGLEQPLETMSNPSGARAAAARKQGAMPAPALMPAVPSGEVPPPQASDRAEGTWRARARRDA